jgi:hypothetical protein
MPFQFNAQTMGETSPSQHPRYSAEWWKDQDRADDSLKSRSMSEPYGTTAGCLMMG